MTPHTTNYFNTFISAATDCRADKGTTPPERKAGPAVAKLQYELIRQHPYRYTSDEILFQVHVRRKDISAAELEAAKTQFFSKGQACMRASPLTKTYGWGIHYNEEGKMALYGRESEAYERLARDPGLKQVAAMRSKKAGAGSLI